MKIEEFYEIRSRVYRAEEVIYNLDHVKNSIREIERVEDKIIDSHSIDSLLRREIVGDAPFFKELLASLEGLKSRLEMRLSDI